MCITVLVDISNNTVVDVSINVVVGKWGITKTNAR